MRPSYNIALETKYIFPPKNNCIKIKNIIKTLTKILVLGMTLHYSEHNNFDCKLLTDLFRIQNTLYLKS